MMYVTSLELRRTRATLKYYVKLLSMPLDRLVRNVVYTPRPRKACRGLGGKKAYTHWLPRTRRLLEIPELKEAVERIKQCLVRNGGVLPLGFDSTLPRDDGSLWYEPIKRWDKDVTDYIKKTELGSAQLTGTSL